MLTGGGASPKASEPTFAISISLLKMHRGQVTQAPDNALTNYQTGTEQDLTWLWRGVRGEEARVEQYHGSSTRDDQSFILLEEQLLLSTMYNKQSGSNTKDSIKNLPGSTKSPSRPLPQELLRLTNHFATCWRP